VQIAHYVLEDVLIQRAQRGPSWPSHVSHGRTNHMQVGVREEGECGTDKANELKNMDMQRVEFQVTK
jgi:hypothetical protein